MRRYCSFFWWHQLAGLPTSQLRTVFRACSAQWFYHIDFWNVLRTSSKQSRMHSSKKQLPKVLRQWGAFNIWTWKCVSHHSSVKFLSVAQLLQVKVRFCHFDLNTCFPTQCEQFLISQKTKMLRTCRLSEPNYLSADFSTQALSLLVCSLPHGHGLLRMRNLSMPA